MKKANLATFVRCAPNRAKDRIGIMGARIDNTLDFAGQVGRQQTALRYRLTGNLTERTAGREHVAGLYERPERNPPFQIPPAVRLAKWSQETIKDPAEQTRAKRYRERAAGPAHGIAGPQAGCVFVDLGDKLRTLETDHFAWKSPDADLDRLSDAKAALGTRTKHGAAYPANFGVTH